MSLARGQAGFKSFLLEFLPGHAARKEMATATLQARDPILLARGGKGG